MSTFRIVLAATLLVLGSASPGLAQGTVTGRVVNVTSGAPLAGAQVSTREGGYGAVANADGRYLLTGLPAGEMVILVQRIGFAPWEGTVTVRSGETVVLDVSLLERALQLEQVIVTGSAAASRRREIGNTLSSIEVGDLIEPPSTVSALLQGRATGLTLTTGEEMGAGAQIRLRGTTSASQSNSPLIYVDGVRQSSSGYPRNNSAGQPIFRGNNYQASPLDDINPADIERIEIIKGAAATTIYGTEAAAGVIQIFTKRGRTGSPAITYQSDLLLSRMQAFGSEQRPYALMDPWLKTGAGQRHALSISGGTESARYFVSGTFMDREGVLPNDEETRVNTRMNLALELSQQLNVDWNASFSTHEVFNTQQGNNAEGLPFLVYYGPANSVGGWEKEKIDQALDMEVSSENQRLLAGMNVRWDPLSNLSNRLTLGYDGLSSRQGQFRPYGFVTLPRGNVVDRRWTSRTLTADFVSTLQVPFTAGLASRISVGGQVAKTWETLIDGYGEGLPGPGRHGLSGAGFLRALEGNEFGNNTGGVFVEGRLDYNDKLFLTAGVRVDGNSAFGEDFGFQSYPKAGLSYVISDEGFWPQRFGTLKLRAAYGHAGKAPGAFDAVRTWEPGSFLNASMFVPRNLGNPNLGPERTEELEFGFDASFLSDRVTLELTYYDQTTRDALLAVAQPASLGFTGSQLENVGEISNKGLEVTVQAVALERANFGWNVGASVFTNKNRVVEVGSATGYRIVPGHPVGVVRGTRITNAREIADPILELDAFFGPAMPTLVLGLNTQLRFPYGIVATATSEYQGGHYIAQGNAAYMITSAGGPGAFECDHLYEKIPLTEYRVGQTHPRVGELNAEERAKCYRGVVTNAMWHAPADFFKLREITVQAPLPFALPMVRSATATAAVRNIRLWKSPELRAFDPEQTASSRNQLTDLTPLSIGQNIPAPIGMTFSLRVAF